VIAEWVKRNPAPKQLDVIPQKEEIQHTFKRRKVATDMDPNPVEKKGS